ncbi:phage tail assembly chaperone [Sphingomonas sp. KC8]|nr:hypothetical protein KC8_17575 [Sphingomonas sp. KC8]
MGLAQAAFGWSAAQFWAATPHELYAMLEMRVEMNKPTQ